MKRTVKLLVIALCVAFTTGCSKKKEPTTPPQPTEKQTQGMMDQAAQTAQETTQAVKEAATAAVEEVKQAFTSQVNLDKSIADLKAEAEKMDVASLMQVAGKYKDAILSNQGEFKTISEKLAAIPMTQRLGDESKQLTTQAQKLTESIKALKDRFDVYLTAIKAKGGDTGSLAI
jgi:hypothetical protein